jgi:competence protein ComEA
LFYDLGMRVLLQSMIAVATCSLVVLSASSQPPSPAAQPADDFPEGAGKAPFLRVCSSCHGPDTILGTLRTRQEWSDVLDQMGRFGAEGTDQDFEQILTYLTKFFSPIKVNTASAKDLENTLDVTTAVAEAIVSYRRDHGPFKAIDDLKAVPGIDAAKLEARKARLVFST